MTTRSWRASTTCSDWARRFLLLSFRRHMWQLTDLSFAFHDWRLAPSFSITSSIDVIYLIIFLYLQDSLLLKVHWAHDSSTVHHLSSKCHLLWFSCHSWLNVSPTVAIREVRLGRDRSRYEYVVRLPQFVDAFKDVIIKFTKLFSTLCCTLQHLLFVPASDSERLLTCCHVILKCVGIPVTKSSCLKSWITTIRSNFVFINKHFTLNWKSVPRLILSRLCCIYRTLDSFTYCTKSHIFSMFPAWNTSHRRFRLIISHFFIYHRVSSLNTDPFEVIS